MFLTNRSEHRLRKLGLSHKLQKENSNFVNLREKERGEKGARSSSRLAFAHSIRSAEPAQLEALSLGRFAVARQIRTVYRAHIAEKKASSVA